MVSYSEIAADSLNRNRNVVNECGEMGRSKWLRTRRRLQLGFHLNDEIPSGAVDQKILEVS